MSLTRGMLGVFHEFLLSAFFSKINFTKILLGISSVTKSFKLAVPTVTI